MMKLGIMQPYFMPYIGYWQLISQVDRYVIFDDVNYIKKGWINRNRILLNGQEHLFVLPLSGASQNKKINELSFFEGTVNKKVLWEKIEHGYADSPCFKGQEAAEVIEACICCEEDELVPYIVNSIQLVCGYLDVKTELVLSSQIMKDRNKKGQEKILDICEKQRADTYINAIGGRELYDDAGFQERGINLRFLKTNFMEYPQSGADFLQGLSMIDILCNVSKPMIKQMLGQYSLIKPLRDRSG